MPPAAFAVSLVDSELAHAESVGADLVLTFSAAAVQRADGVAGYLAPLALVFRSASWSGESGALFGRVSEARLEGAGLPRGLLPLPFAAMSSVHAQLRFANGATLDVRAEGMDVALRGDERFTESYAC